MAGALLLNGPVVTMESLKKSSSVFLLAVNLSKFEAASNKLQALNLGSLRYLRGNKFPVFVKKTPSDIAPYLTQGECEDLCSLEEYTERFNLPAPNSITRNPRAPNLVETIVSMGLVAPELFQP